MTVADGLTGVVVPIRAFIDGGSRLSSKLDPAERARLLESMATRVVTAAAPLPVTVVSSAPEVVAWAEGLGAHVAPDPGSLDAASDAGRAHVRDLGFVRVIVVHADLPLVETLEPLAAPGADPVAVLVPDHHDDGTPVLSVPVAADFAFAYGEGSFTRHVAEARRAGLDVVELRDDLRLRHDVDVVDDLAALGEGYEGLLA